MKLKFYVLLFVFIVNTSISIGQFTDRFWCFGDSAAINFSNLSNPVPAISIIRGRGTCASICDSSGQLLFYAGAPHDSTWNIAGYNFIGFVVNKNHQVMENGDSIAAEAWYEEMIIIPDPGNINRFYLFTSAVHTHIGGLHYSVIDLSYNGGLGKVVQKNIQIQTENNTECIAAVKHGNGRDWWVVVKPSGWNDVTGAMTPRNDYNFYLVTPSGVSGPFVQNFGSLVADDYWRRLEFSKDGRVLYAIGGINYFDRVEFDRCTGQVSNYTNLNPLSLTVNPWSCAISPDGSKLYVAHWGNPCVTQYDLGASNIMSSADTLFCSNILAQSGALKTGPDDKIYFTCQSNYGPSTFGGWAADTVWNNVNSNLSVINYPNNSGAASDFQLFSYYLGGHRTCYGLPNNPNYELQADSGSLCDTLSVGLDPVFNSKSNLFVLYSPQLEKVFVNANDLTGSNFTLTMSNTSGKILINEGGKLVSDLYTRDLELNGFASGLYIICLSTEKEVLIKKLIKH